MAVKEAQQKGVRRPMQSGKLAIVTVVKRWNVSVSLETFISRYETGFKSYES